MPDCSIIAIPMRRTGACVPLVYEVQVNEILITQNPKLVMFPAILLKNETEPDNVPVRSVNLSNGQIQWTKYVSAGSLQLYT